jgi:putative transcriptional regulator
MGTNKKKGTTSVHDADRQRDVETIQAAMEAIERFYQNRYRGGSEERKTVNMDKFPDRVRALRERLSLSQAEFAKRYGLDVSTLRGWEQERRKPDKANRTLVGAIERNPGLIAAIVAETAEDEELESA